MERARARRCRDSHLVCTSWRTRTLDSGCKLVNVEHAPVHVELLLISSLNGASLWETLHYLDRAIELCVNELARVDVHGGGLVSGPTRTTPRVVCSLAAEH